MAVSTKEESLRDVFERVVRDPDLHLATLNLYYHSEFNGAQGIADLIPKIERRLPELAEHLKGHAEDEFRHARMIAELMRELGGEPKTPGGLKYVDEFEALAAGVLDGDEPTEVEIIVGLNVTEKRGLKSFSLHVAALPKDSKAREVLGQIRDEEAGHVRWGNDYVKDLERRGFGEDIKRAEAKFDKIEAAAYEASMDIMPGAPIRRFRRIFAIADELPVERRLDWLADQCLRAGDPFPLLEARWNFVSSIAASPRMREQISTDLTNLISGKPLGDDSILGRLGSDAWRAVTSMFERTPSNA